MIGGGSTKKTFTLFSSPRPKELTIHFFERSSEILQGKQHLSFIPGAHRLTGNQAPNTLWFRVPDPLPWHGPCLQNRAGKILKEDDFYPPFSFQRMCGPRWVSQCSCLKSIQRCSRPPPVSAQNTEGRLLLLAFLFLSIHLSVHLLTAGTYLPRILNNFVTFPLDGGLHNNKLHR